MTKQEKLNYAKQKLRKGEIRKLKNVAYICPTFESVLSDRWSVSWDELRVYHHLSGMPGVMSSLRHGQTSMWSSSFFFKVGQNRTPSFIQLKISFGSTEQQQQKPQTIWQDYPVAFIATAAGSASAWSLFCKAASASSIITLSAITEDYHSNWATIVFFSAKLIDITKGFKTRGQQAWSLFCKFDDHTFGPHSFKLFKTWDSWGV